MFYSPAAVFDRVRERGTWWPPIIAMILVGLIGGALTTRMVSMNTVVRKQLESDPKTMDRLGPEGIERVANNPMYEVFAYAAAIAIPITLLALAGVYTGALSLSGGSVRYSQVLGATAYSWWPYDVLVTAMTLLIILLSPNRDDLNFKNLLVLNAGAFLDPQTTSKPLYSVASSLDLLSFGLMALLSYGLSRVAKQRFGTCAAIVVGVWAVYVLVKAGFAAIF